MQFFFSIIIPVYNSEDYLPRCLDSIVKETFPLDKVQVIVVNDGSPKTEECDEIINAYKNKLNINYLKLETNKGTHVARKKGVETVNSEYFLFVDPDDYLEKKALKSIYEDIQENGDADYISFLFSNLYSNGKKEVYGFIKNINAPNILEDILAYKLTNHSVAAKCFKTLFAKEVWSKMPAFYAYFNEDYYQMAILHYYAKTKKMLKKALYVYLQEVGITGVKKYTKEKLQKTILSIYNVDKYLSEFYIKEHSPHYVPLVQNYSDRLYIHCISRSSIKDFIEGSSGIIDKDSIEKIIIKYISTLSEKIARYKKKERWLFPILCWAFICGKLKINKEAKVQKKFIMKSTEIFKDNTSKSETFEYISYLERQVLFYENRAKFYAPIKFFFTFYRQFL